MLTFKPSLVLKNILNGEEVSAATDAADGDDR